MKNAFVGLLLLFLPFVAHATERHGHDSQRVVATLTLPFAKILPGVPFDLEVTLKNVSAHPVKVGTIAHLTVTLPDGGRIPVSRKDASRLQPYLHSGDETFIELDSGETTRRVVGWDLAAPPNWSSADGFSGPGSYDLALDLAIGVHADDEDLSNYIGVLRTSTARLERVLPPGEDEALWKRIQEAAGGHWTDDGFTRLKAGRELAKEIIDLHPSSGYYPYALILYSIARSEKDIPVLLEAADRFRESAAHAYLLKAAGDAAYRKAGHAAYAHDHVRSTHFATLAEKYYAAALETSSLAVRAGAEAGLQRAKWDREKTAKPHPR